jgi:hydroxymethylbilane synthase
VTVRLRVATRGSALALWQARHVAGLLGGSAGVELVVVETTADRRIDIPIAAMGGKGVFVKEVQAALLDGRADLAVHSAKDLPSLTPDGLVLAAVPERADARDVLVGARLATLATGARVATGSARRQSQLARHRPDLRFSGLRGNIATRLAKVGEYDAIVMAKAALDRLGLEPEVAIDVLDTSVLVPQVGQGALAVECRADDERTLGLLRGLEHAESRWAVDAERAFLAELGGDCTIPAGAHAVVERDDLRLTGVLASLDGRILLKESRQGRDAELLGRLVARHLLDDAGGATLLR